MILIGLHDFDFSLSQKTIDEFSVTGGPRQTPNAIFPKKITKEIVDHIGQNVRMKLKLIKPYYITNSINFRRPQPLILIRPTSVIWKTNIFSPDQ